MSDASSSRRFRGADHRMTRLRFWAPYALLMAMLGTSSRLARAAGERSVRFEFRGPPSCGDDARLASEVRARTQQVMVAAPGETPDLTLRVRIHPPESPGRAAVKGDLVLTDSHGLASRRTLSGESCEAVVSSLALVAALAIDPLASTAPIPPASLPAPVPPPPPPPAPDMPPPLATAVPAETQAPPTGLPDPPATTERLLEEPPPEPQSTPRRRSHWRSAVGLDVGVLEVGAPSVVATGGAFVDVASASPDVVSPSFRLSVQRSLGTTVPTSNPSESATLYWTFGRAEACPVRISVSSTVDLRPCALIDVGALYASASAPANAQSSLQPWAATGGLARLERAATISAGWSFVLDAQAGLVVPLARQTFRFDDGAFVYHAPLVTGLASVAAGVRFP